MVDDLSIHLQRVAEHLLKLRQVTFAAVCAANAQLVGQSLAQVGLTWQSAARGVKHDRQLMLQSTKSRIVLREQRGLLMSQTSGSFQRDHRINGVFHTDIVQVATMQQLHELDGQLDVMSSARIANDIDNLVAFPVRNPRQLAAAGLVRRSNFSRTAENADNPSRLM